MLRLHVTTKLPSEEVMKKAIAFFGPGGNELEIKEAEDNFAYFEGGGGGVEIATEDEDGKTGVEFVTREWEYQVKEFAKMIKR